MNDGFLPFASQTDKIAPERSYAVYVFRQQANDGTRSSRRLSWVRDAICTDLASAMTRAEMARTQDHVKRVQIFELHTDTDGTMHTGRIVKTIGGSFLQNLLHA